jgi:hypothetical protein
LFDRVELTREHFRADEFFCELRSLGSFLNGPLKSYMYQRNRVEYDGPFSTLHFAHEGIQFANELRSKFAGNPKEVSVLASRSESADKDSGMT